MKKYMKRDPDASWLDRAWDAVKYNARLAATAIYVGLGAYYLAACSDQPDEKDLQPSAEARMADAVKGWYEELGGKGFVEDSLSYDSAVGEPDGDTVFYGVFYSGPTPSLYKDTGWIEAQGWNVPEDTATWTLEDWKVPKEPGRKAYPVVYMDF